MTKYVVNHVTGTINVTLGTARDVDWETYYDDERAALVHAARVKHGLMLDAHAEYLKARGTYIDANQAVSNWRTK